jgi:hypothetical protein
MAREERVIILVFITVFALLGILISLLKYHCHILEIFVG